MVKNKVQRRHALKVHQFSRSQNKENELLSVHIAGYRGWLLQRYNIASFWDCFEELLTSGFTSQSALTVAHDREVYHLRLKSENLEHVQSDDIYVKRYHFASLKQVVQTLFHVRKPF